MPPPAAAAAASGAGAGSALAAVGKSFRRRNLLDVEAIPRDRPAAVSFGCAVNTLRCHTHTHYHSTQILDMPDAILGYSDNAEDSMGYSYIGLKPGWVGVVVVLRPRRLCCESSSCEEPVR